MFSSRPRRVRLSCETRNDRLEPNATAMNHLAMCLARSPPLLFAAHSLTFIVALPM
jgi:hypothetical protein